MTTAEKRPIVLAILDGWGYAPRTGANAIAGAHTPYYDEICRRFPMTTLSAVDGESGDSAAGDPELGHLKIGTGREVRTEAAMIHDAIVSGEFEKNAVLTRMFAKAKEGKNSVHLIGLLSDSGVHSSPENLFALLRMAKSFGLEDVNIHAILDGLDVAPRTADIYLEALEIKLADIGVGKIASMCGRFFAMDTGENWERTARAFTMLVHGEGERATDPVAAVRNSFLRGIADEFIAPIVLEKAPDIPVSRVKNGDLVIFFNHRGDGMKQLVRSLCMPGGANTAKPIVETVCLTDYESSFNLPSAFRQKPFKRSLAEVLVSENIPIRKITEPARQEHLASIFDGRNDLSDRLEQELLVLGGGSRETYPESQSFKIVDRFRREIEKDKKGVYIVNLPAAGLAAESGDVGTTVAAIQFVDTCLGGIWEKTEELGGTLLVTSSYGICEEMVVERDEQRHKPTMNQVPFHLVSGDASGAQLADGRTLADVAPTILSMLGIDKPIDMTGSDLRLI
ncbi:MAG: 2,3-bisphosphoglycerate-independent phosphoglycerate mutase [Acidobacteria bacterium]|nr:2,3-bisphosphoglycerate-independent phosphoglycerate mutase [Acidobacteriota bacterium]